MWSLVSPTAMILNIGNSQIYTAFSFQVYAMCVGWAYLSYAQYGFVVVVSTEKSISQCAERYLTISRSWKEHPLKYLYKVDTFSYKQQHVELFCFVRAVCVEIPQHKTTAAIESLRSVSVSISQCTQFTTGIRWFHVDS